MISPERFHRILGHLGVDFFTGVPDSLLKPYCSYLLNTCSHSQHVIAANEGSAVGIAIGYHLATGKTPAVYLQNSGLGNTYNPLASLADPEIYGIPMFLIIGWRGELLMPNRYAQSPASSNSLPSTQQLNDEPQHTIQGKITLQTLDTMGIPYRILEPQHGFVEETLRDLYSQCQQRQGPVALVVRKNCFEHTPLNRRDNGHELSREQAIESVISNLPSSTIFVGTTGKASRELFELRAKRNEDHIRDFLTVGGMGHANQIAFGMALAQPQTRICCIDGDGALLMHMGGMAKIATCDNYIHIMLNNDAHDSVGGQPPASANIDFSGVAKACGYRYVHRISQPGALKATLSEIARTQGSAFIEIDINRKSRHDLGRPTHSPKQNKNALIQCLAHAKPND